jgi:membrane protein DedA with SNARE-associated domain
LPWLDSFLNFLDSLPNALVYILLGVSAFVENVFPPIPGDTITAFGAFLVGARRLSFMGVYLATTSGSLLGFMCLFWIGGLLGRRFFIERDYRLFKASDIIKAEGWFKKYGYFLILLNRFFPGIRSVISVAGGVLQLRPLKVILLALVSASLWNLIWISLGYTIGANWENAKVRMAHIMRQYNIAILVVFGIAIAVLLVLMMRKKRSLKR